MEPSNHQVNIDLESKMEKSLSGRQGLIGCKSTDFLVQVCFFSLVKG